MEWAALGVLLVVLAFMTNEALKRASRWGYGASGICCRVCGRTMRQVQVHWAYRLPYEVWMYMAKFNLKASMVRRYLCPQEHQQAWVLPSDAARKCEVAVFKDYRIG